MPARKVSTKDPDAMHKALVEGTYAAVRFLGEEVVELFVADTHQEIEEAFEKMKCRPGECQLHQKAN